MSTHAASARRRRCDHRPGACDRQCLRSLPACSSLGRGLFFGAQSYSWYNMVTRDSKRSDRMFGAYLSLPHTHTQTPTHTLSHTHTHTSLSHTHTHTRTYTHTHTHTRLTHTLSLSHTHTLSEKTSDHRMPVWNGSLVIGFFDISRCEMNLEKSSQKIV